MPSHSSVILYTTSCAHFIHFIVFITFIINFIDFVEKFRRFTPYVVVTLNKGLSYIRQAGGPYLLAQLPLSLILGQVMG